MTTNEMKNGRCLRGGSGQRIDEICRMCEMVPTVRRNQVTIGMPLIASRNLAYRLEYSKLETISIYDQSK